MSTTESTEWGERKAGASKAEVESGKWIEVQKRIFTRWANAYLRMRKLKIDDLYTDLADGVKLCNLLEVLSKETIRYKKHPKMEIHKRENLKSAFEFMAKHKLPLTNVGSSDVFSGNEKIILGLMWTIIAKFQVRYWRHCVPPMPCNRAAALCSRGTSLCRFGHSPPRARLRSASRARA